ncbi:MAG: hypothetical protein FJ387_17325 [Verrucomicrobia bacterium]|nr:hypothetical protein [Verrucomicrobiota bacterium]
MKQDTKRKPKDQPRDVLVVLSNRLSLNAPVYHVELRCKADGTILKETPLKREPQEARFDEVWVNEEGKRTIADCTRFKRIYRHKLERRPAAAG